MKIFITLLLVILSTLSFAQKEFKPAFFTLEHDTLTAYLDEDGVITTQSKARFYRKAPMDKATFSYSGQVEDYYINQQIAYRVNYMQGLANGEVRCYYPDGVLKYQGHFTRSLRDSIWTYYYDNGKIEKIIQYVSGNPTLKSYYKKNGKAVFTDGNGKYKGTIPSGPRDNTECEIKGMIKNGQPDGRWFRSVHNMWNDEYFENGVFIKGYSGYEQYTRDPKISLTGFDWHENVQLLNFKIVPFEHYMNTFFWELPKFRSSIHLNEDFTPVLQHYLDSLNQQHSIAEYWAVLQFTISAANCIEQLNVKSDNELISNSICTFFKELQGLEGSYHETQRIECGVYIALYCAEGKVTIPPYTYDQNYEIMDLVPH